MTKKLPANERKHQILQTLAHMLEQGDKITTAHLAARAQVSEATLYKHFTNKEQLFAALLQFNETNVFSLINQINQHPPLSLSHLERIAHVVLQFATQNPGITRLLLHAEPLSHSTKLAQQSRQFFNRLESQFKQNTQQAGLMIDHAMAANMLLSLLEGKLYRYVHSEFKHLPLEHWPEQWRLFQNIWSKP